MIRLKQVEHVRNERNVLAAVAGHPFITTMVASFQDQDTLYMLVNRFSRPCRLPELTFLLCTVGLLPWW